MKFKYNENIERIAPEIYLYKNFLDSKELESVENTIKHLQPHNWINIDMWKNDSEIIAGNQVIQGNQELTFLYDKSKSFFEPEYSPLPYNGISRFIPGQSLEVHFDSPGHPDDQDEEYLSSFYKQLDIENKDVPIPLNDPLGTCHTVLYGYIIYLSDFEGGEVYYPDLGIEIKPSKGDMIIHSSSKKYRHGVKPILSGIRYAYSNFITLPENMNLDINKYDSIIEEIKEKVIKTNVNVPMHSSYVDYWNSKKEYIDKDLWVIRNFLSQEEVDYLMLRAQEDDGWYTTMRSPYGNIRNKWIDQTPKYDENGNLIMPSEDLATVEVPFFHDRGGIFDRLHSVLPKTYKQHNTLQSFFSISDEEIKEKNPYIDPSWPAMDWHFDSMELDTNRMTGAFTIYLNDNFEGGILEFKNKPYKIKPEPGMLVNIPINEEFTHRVTRVTNGNRHTLYGNCWEDINKAPISTTENC